ncbi:uncharacterized protein ASPGLDRAFT_58752 [Aspergillus glaucus CBS 516.65]|uniref:Uncharacterized protein n=1 Tax=Aspergillus glaucus CBS 516.65 TaxID=1160497 RepID=A0A1L9VGA8_ASPGL|nr:hypothetical protein ASPGLDRAFT_58752 [Aspergillus glaucus CBS 516.65]OJJ82934.1 hypothetical protein ASPGLDRAFT_58752 [Aspergillus glaucus CBS 516.65]
MSKQQIHLTTASPRSTPVLIVLGFVFIQIIEIGQQPPPSAPEAPRLGTILQTKRRKVSDSPNPSHPHPSSNPQNPKSTMQKNIAICVIILVTLGAIVASWLAFRYWKRRFKRELLVTYHIRKQRMPVRELAPVQVPSTSTSSSGRPVEWIERPARKKRERRITREPDAEPLVASQKRDYVSRQRETTTAPPPVAPAPPPSPTHASPTTTATNTPKDKGKQRDTSEWSQPADTPATTEQSSPSAPAQGEWSNTSNAETSSEWGQRATQSEPSQGEWGAGQNSPTKDSW